MFMCFSTALSLAIHWDENYNKKKHQSKQKNPNQQPPPVLTLEEIYLLKISEPNACIPFPNQAAFK